MDSVVNEYHSFADELDAKDAAPLRQESAAQASSEASDEERKFAATYISAADQMDKESPATGKEQKEDTSKLSDEDQSLFVRTSR